MQVVIIAAGYDTRAYRLGKPGVKFYEIDLPHASETKQQLVKKHMPADKVRISRRAACRSVALVGLQCTFVAGAVACRMPARQSRKVRF